MPWDGAARHHSLQNDALARLLQQVIQELHLRQAGVALAARHVAVTCASHSQRSERKLTSRAVSSAAGASPSPSGARCTVQPSARISACSCVHLFLHNASSSAHRAAWAHAAVNAARAAPHLRSSSSVVMETTSVTLAAASVAARCTGKDAQFKPHTRFASAPARTQVLRHVPLGARVERPALGACGVSGGRVSGRQLHAAARVAHQAARTRPVRRCSPAPAGSASRLGTRWTAAPPSR
jgi:hypothetical protein